MKYLKDSHPTKQKLDKLWVAADALNIRLDFMGHVTTITDLDTGLTYKVLDNDNKDAIVSWPAETEYTVVGQE